MTLPSVSSQMLNDTIGYIRIESFEKDTANQFEKALAELEGEGLTSLVVDLRYNGGLSIPWYRFLTIFCRKV